MLDPREAVPSRPDETPPTPEPSPGRPPRPRAEVHPSPPLRVLALVTTALVFASILAPLLFRGAGTPVPVPVPDALAERYLRFPRAVRVEAFFQFAAAIPLGLFTATLVSRLFFHRVRVAGVHIALFGGIAAAIFLAFAGLATWTLAVPAVASDGGALRALRLFAYASGGFAHTAALGLLLAGASVPALAFGLVPRWIGWFGLGAAAVCEVATLGMVAAPFSVLVPIGRFAGLAWMLAAGFTLPRTRRATSGEGAR